MPVIRDMILDRVSIKKEKNALILVVGQTGEGKSDYCNSFGLELDPGFNPNRVAHKTVNNFIRILNHDKNLKRGSVINWDDAGKGLKRDEWYLRMNKIVRDVLQTFRIDGLIVFVNCPDASYIDSKVLKLFHYWVEMDHIDYEKQLAYVRFYSIQTNNKSGKTYWHRPTYIDDTGTLRRIDFHVTRKTPDWFDKEYRKEKRKTNKDIKLEGEKELNNLEEDERRKNLTVEDMVSEISADFGEYISEYKKRKYFDIYMIMSKFKVGRWKAMQVKKQMEEKYKRQLKS
jgi:hypothetical protein